MSKISYANVIGCMTYLMICMRPDLTHSISVLSKFMSNHGKEHWDALKWLLKYLKGISELGLVFKMNKDEIILKGYTDSNFTRNRNIRRSASSYFYTLCGTWKSHLQEVVALSSTEVEYIFATDTIKEYF